MIPSLAFYSILTLFSPVLLLFSSLLVSFGALTTFLSMIFLFLLVIKLQINIVIDFVILSTYRASSLMFENLAALCKKLTRPPVSRRRSRDPNTIGLSRKIEKSFLLSSLREINSDSSLA
ncbi:hypothetical protein DSO57_1028952 [Entomophthora muscae]|uniref:Uncharacterized protein n=1 Tax=Entomophthora muscae TaxID=34485 RepID=A0ACC2RG42_9FUNG|nr:hypothetical protein DSO57_1028952 [Entomophthora muscae]